jgi:hypothetical protein
LGVSGSEHAPGTPLGYDYGKMQPSKGCTRVLRLIGLFVAGCGVYNLIKTDVVSYMFLRSMFVFFDFEQPLLLFFADYLSMMGLWVFIGHYSAKVLLRISKRMKCVKTRHTAIK